MSADNHFNFGGKKSIDIIIESIINTYPHFLNALKTHINQNLKNEKQLTQEFTTQNQIQLNNLGLSCRIKDEYSDNFYETKGIPDFAFLPLVEGESHEPLFIVEAKILPTPCISKKREKTEYVYYKNEKKHGGIERFKTEKHGKGLSKCGMLAFISSENYSFWFHQVNEWIEEAHLFNSIEKLKPINDAKNYHKSLVYREGDMLELLHFWIEL